MPRSPRAVQAAAVRTGAKQQRETPGRRVNPRSLRWHPAAAVPADLSAEPGSSRFQADDRFVRALARRLTGDLHLADDAAQETWLAALQQAAAPALFPGPSRGWLATVARNFVLQALRGQQRREAAVARCPLLDADEGVDVEPERRRRMLAAVQDLPADYRAVVHQRFFEDRMPVEIADALRLPVETVRTRLRRALERLRAGLTSPRA